MSVRLEVTKHFKDRCKTRLGISKKDAIRYFYKAYDNGLRIGDFTNAAIKKYLCQLTRGYDTDIEAIVVNHYIIIAKHTSHNSCLAITILNIPNKYLYIVDNTFERRNKRKYGNSSRKKAKRTNDRASEARSVYSSYNMR